MMIVRNSLLVLAAVAALSTSDAAGVKRIRNRNVIKVNASATRKTSSLMQENKKVEADLAALFNKEHGGRDLQDMSMSMGGGGGGGDMSMDMGGGSGGGGDMSMSMDMSPARNDPAATLIPPLQVVQDGESDGEGDEPTLTADEPIDAVTDGDADVTTDAEDATSDNSDSSRAPPEGVEGGEEAIVEATGDDSGAV
ncbi:MAG: hypothetical protein SGARI_007840, partial [Bacillariaceae sp.]